MASWLWLFVLASRPGGEGGGVRHMEINFRTGDSCCVGYFACLWFLALPRPPSATPLN